MSRMYLVDVQMEFVLKFGSVGNGMVDIGGRGGGGGGVHVGVRMKPENKYM